MSGTAGWSVAGSAPSGRQGRTTVAEYAGRWLETLQVRDQTRYHYEIYLRRHLLPALGNRGPSTLRRSDIQGLVTTVVSKGLRPSTVDSIYKIAAMVLRSAVHDRLIPVSPCYKIKVPPREERKLAVFSPEQARRLLAVTRPREHALFALTIATGMGQGEALGVRRPNLNLLRRELAVEEQCLTPPRGRLHITGDRKTKAGRRRLPLPQFAVLALARHLQTEPVGDDGALFVSPLGNLWRRGSFSESVWKPALLRADLDAGYGFHARRHTYASSGPIAQGSTRGSSRHALVTRRSARPWTPTDTCFPTPMRRRRRPSTASSATRQDSDTLPNRGLQRRRAPTRPPPAQLTFGCSRWHGVAQRASPLRGTGQSRT